MLPRAHVLVMTFVGLARVACGGPEPGATDSASTSSSTTSTASAPTSSTTDPTAATTDPVKTDIPQEAVCKVKEPEGTRLALGPCEACVFDSMTGSVPERWLAVRLAPPAYPFAVTSVAAVVHSTEPVTIFHFVSADAFPPAEPVVTAQEVPFDAILGDFVIQPIDPPRVLAEGESIYVGLRVVDGVSVADCEQEPQLDDGIFLSDEPAPFAWYPLGAPALEVFAYGQQP